MKAGGNGRQGVGQILRHARRMAGLTQEEVAERTGLSVRAVGDLERGRTGRPHRRSVQLLAEALELPESAYDQLMDALRRQVAASALEQPGPAGRAAAHIPNDDDQAVGLIPEAVQQRLSASVRGLPRDELGGTLLAGAAAARLGPAQLPADIADFTGRSEQVGSLRRILSGRPPQDSSGAVTMALVAGAGGTGKTTLAVHAAHLLRRQFPDGQFYADLLGATEHPAPPSDVLARFLRDLGVDPARIPVGEEERAAQYRSRLTDRG